MSAQYPEWFSKGDQSYLRGQLQPNFGDAATGGASSLGNLFSPSQWSKMGEFGALTGLGGALGGLLFGGDQGYGDISPLLKQYLGKATGYLSPYEKTGRDALSEYFAQLNQAKDPEQFIGNIMSHYSESPGVQFQKKEGLADISTGAASRGLLGSGAQARSMMQFGQGLASQGQEQYLRDVLGLRGQTLGGLRGLGTMGEQAAGQMGQWAYGTGENLANLQSQMDAAAEKQQGGIFGDILGAVGSLAFL